MRPWSGPGTPRWGCSAPAGGGTSSLIALVHRRIADVDLVRPTWARIFVGSIGPAGRAGPPGPTMSDPEDQSTRYAKAFRDAGIDVQGHGRRPGGRPDPATRPSQPEVAAQPSTTGRRSATPRVVGPTRSGGSCKPWPTAVDPEHVPRAYAVDPGPA